MQTPTVISDAFSGLTNVLFAMSAMVYLSSKLHHVPFESVGFLDIGCSGRSVRITQSCDLFDFKAAGERLNVSMKEVGNNYCYTAVIPANSSEFDFSTSKIEGSKYVFLTVLFYYI